MSENTRKATKKRPIETVSITVTLEANRINENGTFSSFKVKSVKGPAGIAVAIPPQGGGSIFLKTDSLEGIQFRTDDSGAEVKEKKKLF